MLQTNDVGILFEKMIAAYGNRWTQPVDAMPDWQKALSAHSADEVMDAAERAVKEYPDFPATLGQFLGLLRGSTSQDSDSALVDRVYGYTKPESSTNPNGNPHKITLPERVASRRPVESVEDYRRRISDAVTFAKYPRLGPDGRSVGDYI